MSETLSQHVTGQPLVRSSRPEIELGRPRLAIVLAAGRSERLAAVTGGGSKALVRMGGLSLVERAVRTLLAAGMERVVVVVGYQAGPVATVVNRIAPDRVRAVFAERWELGNGASLAAAEPHVAEERGFLLVTTDHVFSDGALEPLLAADRAAVLVDHAPDPNAWAEGTRVSLHEERAVAFSKDLGDPSIDCGAFLLPPSAFDAQRRTQARGDASLAGAVTELARVHPLEAVPLPQTAWWHDVDTPEDLRAVSSRLRRSLTKEADGPVSRYVNRPISTRASMALAHLPIHPDVVSVVAFLFALGGAWALAVGAGVAGGLLVLASSILDGVDGEIARLRIRASWTGSATPWCSAASRCGHSTKETIPRPWSSSRLQRPPARCSRWRPRTGSLRSPSRPRRSDGSGSSSGAEMPACCSSPCSPSSDDRSRRSSSWRSRRRPAWRLAC